METQRIIKYRAKGMNPCDGWVKGGLYYTDNNHNDPFNTRPINTKYFIVCYFSGDWGMGKWEHVEVIPKTIQEFTGEHDSHSEDIYEGDVLHIHSVSYDEDGTRSISNNFIEGVVIFEDGMFLLDTGNTKLQFPLKSATSEIKIVGNVLSLKKNKIANEYRANELIKDFDKHRINNYPEHIDAAFISFAKEVTQILMDDYICTYNKGKEQLVIVFRHEYKRYMISKSNLDTTPEYQLYICDENHLLNKFIEITKTSNFQTIINTIEKCKKDE